MAYLCTKCQQPATESRPIRLVCAVCGAGYHRVCPTATQDQVYACGCGGQLRPVEEAIRDLEDPASLSAAFKRNPIWTAFSGMVWLFPLTTLALLGIAAAALLRGC